MYLRPGFVVVIVGATLTSLSTIVVALRYYSRHVLMRTVGASDHLMLFALILTWGNFVVNFYQDDTSRGFKPSFLRIPAKRPIIEARLRGNLIAWWVYRMNYIFALGFVKLSILFFYRAIASHRTFRRFVNCAIAFVCMYTLGTTLASIFQCQNPADSWSTAGYLNQFLPKGQKIKQHKVKCFDPAQLWLFSAAVNLLTDIIIMLLPIPALLSLRVPMTKRLALIAIFSIGIMAIVASSIRLWVMTLWAGSPNAAARFGTDLLLWGQVETNSGIICASIPFLRMIFVGQKKEDRCATPKVVDVGPPQPRGGQDVSQNRPLEKPLEVDTWAVSEAEKRSNDDAPGWQPFITIPENLSIRGRDDMLEPAHQPHMTV